MHSKYLAEHVAPVQEFYQAKKDEEAKTFHEKNKGRYDEKITKWTPVVGELVDYRRPIDPSSKDSRKMAVYFASLYVVTKVRNPYAIKIKEIDAQTFQEVEGSEREVWTGDCRPTLELVHQQRKRLRAEKWDEERKDPGNEAKQESLARHTNLVRERQEDKEKLDEGPPSREEESQR